MDDLINHLKKTSQFNDAFKKAIKYKNHPDGIAHPKKLTFTVYTEDVKLRLTAKINGEDEVTSDVKRGD